MSDEQTADSMEAYAARFAQLAGLAETAFHTGAFDRESATMLHVLTLTARDASAGFELLTRPLRRPAEGEAVAHRAFTAAWLARDSAAYLPKDDVARVAETLDAEGCSDKAAVMRKLIEEITAADFLGEALEAAPFADWWGTPGPAGGRITPPVENLPAALTGENLPAIAPRARKGQRLPKAMEELFKTPVSMPAREFLNLLLRGVFLPTEDKTAVFAENEKAQIRVECTPETGFDPERAIEILLQKGPSVVQTFLAMCGLWLQNKSACPHDSYLTASVNDLLRYMGKRATNKGGYHAEDVLRRGVDVFILMQTSVPKAENVRLVGRGAAKKQRVTVSISRPVQVETLTAQLTLDANDPQAVIEFRYHLGEEIHGWLCGEHPQYALASIKLLRYNPQNDEKAIRFGLALVCYDKLNRHKKEATRRITLPSLLTFVSETIPARNVSTWLKGVERAVTTLAKDGVIPDARLCLPPPEAQKTLSARQIAEAATIKYAPIAIPATEPARILPV